LDGLANTLVDCVVGEADIVKSDVEPGGPYNSKEANVCEELGVVTDAVIGREGCEVRYEEQIEKQLDSAGFMPGREHQTFLVNALEGVLDPRYNVVDPSLLPYLVQLLAGTTATEGCHGEILKTVYKLYTNAKTKVRKPRTK